MSYHHHHHHHPKSPKSPLTRQWLALMNGDGGCATDEEEEEEEEDRDDQDEDDEENDDDDHEVRANKPKHTTTKPTSSLVLAKSHSHDNKSWWSFVTESPSEELEAMSGVVAPSRKVRFDKALPKSLHAPPPILKTSSSYGGGTTSHNNNNNNNTHQHSVQKYHKRGSSSQSETQTLISLIQERLFQSSCGGMEGTTSTSTATTHCGGGRSTSTTPLTASKKVAEDFFQTWERRLERLWGTDDDEYYYDDPAQLRSFSDDTYSEASNNPRRHSAPAAQNTSSRPKAAPESPGQSPRSWTSTEESWDEVFLSRDASNDRKKQTPSPLDDIVATRSYDCLSTGSSKYKDMLKRAKMNSQKSGTTTNPSTASGKKSSGLAQLLPTAAIKSNNNPRQTSQGNSKSSSRQLDNGRTTPPQPHLAERNRRSLAPAAVTSDDHSSSRSGGGEGHRRRKLDVKYRLELLKTTLRPQEEDDPEIMAATTTRRGSGDEDRSSKENGRPLSRSEGTRMSGTTTLSSSSREQQPLPHPNSQRARQSYGASHPSQPQYATTTAAAAAWVAAPAISGLSDDSGGKKALRQAPVVALPDEGRSRMCVPPMLQNRFRRRRLQQQLLQYGTNAQDGPPSTITTIPQVVSQLDDCPHQHRHEVIPVPLQASELHQLHQQQHYPPRADGSLSTNSNRHAYVAYFHRGVSARASKTMRMYEHPTPPQFPTLESEVVVKVLASTVNETDNKIRQGLYWGDGKTKHPLDLPVVPGTAFCGTVVQLDKRNNHTSSNSYGLKLGDCVMSLVRVGANSRHLCIGSERVVKVPTEIRDHAAAVCLPEVYLTAFQALHMDQRLGVRYRKNALVGKSILILGGTTKVGRALIELATLAGSGTVYATAKDKQFKLVEEAGGVPLDRDPHHWYSLLVGKMDLVVCVDCEDVQHSELKYEHIQTLTRTGKILLLNGPEYDGERTIDLNKVDDHSRGTLRRLYHYNVFESWETDMKLAKRDLEHLLKLLADGLIAPTIFERIPLFKVARAHEVIQKRPLSGFVVCEPWLPDNRQSDPNSAAE